MEGENAYCHAPEYHVTFGKGDFILLNKISYRPQNFLRGD